MPYLNLCSGANRPPEPWVNLDEIRNHLPLGSDERRNLDSEKNYVNHFLGQSPMPFQPDSFNGVLASHVIEHWPLSMAISVLQDCHRILLPGAPIVVSVPDASYFRKVHQRDSRANAVELFGEPLPETERACTFLDYALLYHQHVQLFCEDSLWALLRGVGFEDHKIKRLDPQSFLLEDTETQVICNILNRRQYSLVMRAQKS